MRQSIFLPSESRGNTNIGWLNGHHSFNFGNFYQIGREAFGPLIIFNDDIVKAGKGFGTHSHANMEIISIPISGSITHADSTGKTAQIHSGDIQIMSAGTGISHSEYNDDKQNDLNFLQIWIEPKVKNIVPRYQQISALKFKPNQLTQVVSPDENEGSLWINQDAWLSMGHFEPGNKVSYKLKDNSNGLYIFVIEGELTNEEIKLKSKDALKLWGTDEFTFHFSQHSQILLIEVPVNF